MRHVPAVFARQPDQCSFAERAEVGDLPQDRLAPRHEPIPDGFCAIHSWTVLLQSNKGNKKTAGDDILLPPAPAGPLSMPNSPRFHFFPAAPRCDEFHFLSL